MSALRLTNSIAPPPPAGIDANADWASRSGNAGVFFKENFNYADLSAASTHATNLKYYGSSTGNPPDSAIMSINAGGLSAKYLRIKYPANSGGSGYSWLYTFDVNNGIQVPGFEGPHDDFYFQIIFRADRHWDFPFKQSGDEMASPKVLIIDRHDSSSNAGEVVLTNDHGRMVPQVYIGFTPSHGSQLIQRSTNTPQGTPDYANQPSVDDGTPSSPSTMADYRNRYGPWNSDTPSIATASVTGSSSINALGFPKEGCGMKYHRNEWDVITFHLNGAGDRAKFWGSKYGEAPLLLGDTNNINFGGAIDFGRAATQYTGFQLTPFITGNVNAAGSSQPETWIDYAEIIASDNPIPHPGGFGLPGTSDLALLAASMASGDWATFTMGGLTNATLTAVGGTPTITTFSSNMLWDAVHKKIVFTGCAHTGGSDVSGAAGTAMWDDAMNTWSRDTYTGNSDNFGHAYMHATMHPTTGDMYRRYFNSAVVRRKLYNTTGLASWETGIVADITGDYANQVSGALVWFDELNSGAGGLVFVDTLGANWSNSALSSWSTQSGDSTSGNFDNVAVRAGGFVYFGGGQGNTNMYRMNASGTVTSQTAFPLSPGYNSSGQGILLPHPDGTGLVLLQCGTGASANVWTWGGSSWTQQGDHTIPEAEFIVGCTVPDYGVCVFVVHGSGGGGTPVVRVYKP